MKKLSICLFALLWCLPCVLMAQSGLHGKVEYLVIEDFDWHDSTGLPTPDVYNSCRAELLFDARRAFYHEYFEMDEEKREAIMQKELERLKQEAAEADEEGRKELNLTIEVPSSNKHYYVLTERQPAPVRLWEYGTFLKAEKEKVIVADTLGSQWVEWQMIPGEKREILGFQCKKAVGTFRGRRYVAWYCPEIPVPYGPWKLYGLPGLILEAYDESHQIAFLPEKIELNTAVSIPAELPEAKQVSFEEYLKMAEKRAKKLTRYSGSVSENSVKIEGLELRGRDYFIKIK